MATVDTRQLAALSLRLKKSTTPAQQARFYERTCRILAALFLRKVIKRTPVGDGQFEAIRGNDGTYTKYKKGKRKGKQKLQRLTNGGTLRRGWTAGENTNPMAFAGTLKVRKLANNYIIEVKNAVYYASYVEYGHRQTPGRFVPVLGKKLKKSWVRGQFMMTRSAMELQQEAPAILQRELAKYLREVFNGK